MKSVAILLVVRKVLLELKGIDNLSFVENSLSVKTRKLGILNKEWKIVLKARKHFRVRMLKPIDCKRGLYKKENNSGK